MRIQNIRFNDLSFSTLYCHYTSNFNELREFYEVDPFNDQELIEAAQNRGYPGNRDQLVEGLLSFNSPFGVDEKALANIESLRDPDTLTVTTGQQMMIYGGPLFTVFKTITTILLAKKLSSLTGKRVIPVFWLADEDHDYNEVACIKLPAQNDIKAVKLPGHKIGPSVGRLDISSAIGEFYNQVRELLPETDFTPDLLHLLEDAYQSGNMKVGFARILAKLFSKHGLIFAGSDDASFKQLLKKPLQIAVENADHIQKTLLEQSGLIEKKYHQQALVQGTTLFLHDDDHGRLRLNNNNGKWSSDYGQEWDVHQMVWMAQNHPERFSPNVFLRPILQDYLLPNIAYIGGPAELAYYGQMKTLYPMFDLTMPAIVPRLSATLIESSIDRILEHLPFRPHEYKARIEDLEKDYIKKLGHGEADELFLEWKEKIQHLSDEYIKYIAEYDASLTGSAGKETANYKKAIDKIQQKLKRSIKQKEDIQLTRIRKIQQHMFPCGVLQEREISITYFMNKYGIHLWDQIIENLDTPYFDSHKIIYL